MKKIILTIITSILFTVLSIAQDNDYGLSIGQSRRWVSDANSKHTYIPSNDDKTMFYISTQYGWSFKYFFGGEYDRCFTFFIGLPLNNVGVFLNILNDKNTTWTKIRDWKYINSNFTQVIEFEFDKEYKDRIFMWRRYASDDDIKELKPYKPSILPSTNKKL